MGTKKITEQDRIEAANLMEEASGIFDSCVKCGMCKALCPVFRILKKEQFSARGQGILLSEKIMDRIVFECTLCMACEQRCPLNIRVCDAIRKGREAMVLLKREPQSNKDMVENAKRYGNPLKEGKD